MALRAALVDRAYLLRSEEAKGPSEEVEEVEGTIIFTEPDEESPPEEKEFRCRLDLSGGPEVTKEGMTATNPRPKLLCDRRYKDGTPLDLRTSDQLKVVTKRLGEIEIWEIDEDPIPLRKKSGRVIGWEVAVHRLEEN